MAASGVTHISKSYLLGLATQLGTLKQQVQDQISGLGPAYETTMTGGPLQAISDSLSVKAGAPPFAMAATLNQDLKAMGGSVNSQLTWLKKILTDMIQELTTTADKMSNTEDLNSEQAAALITDFQGVLSDVSAGPSSTTTPPPAT
jgi:hypothetical protein